MASQHARRPTVLLVEDFDDDRRMYAEFLRHHHFVPIEADNTADALAMAVRADVIVTGIRVAGPFDGVELVRRLRLDARSKRKAIVVLTACTFEPDQQRAGSAGCDAFLPKPCLPETLITEIDRVLALRLTHPPAHRSSTISRHRRGAA